MFTSQESKFEVVEKKGPNLKPKRIAHKQTCVSLCGSFIHAHSNAQVSVLGLQDRLAHGYDKELLV